MLKIMDSFLSASEEDMPDDAEGFIRNLVPYVEVDLAEDFDQVVRNVLSGPAARPYNRREDAKYRNQQGAVASRIDKD